MNDLEIYYRNMLDKATTDQKDELCLQALMIQNLAAHAGGTCYNVQYKDEWDKLFDRCAAIFGTADGPTEQGANAVLEAIAKEQDDRLSGERDQSVEGRDALNNDSALPAPDSKAKEQDDKRMDELGITEQDIAETKPPEPGR